MSLVSAYAVPLLVLIILISGIRARLPLFELFVEGAAEGLQICVKIFPYVLGMLVAISLFRSSGALTALAAFVQCFAYTGGCDSLGLDASAFRQRRSGLDGGDHQYPGA